MKILESIVFPFSISILSKHYSWKKDSAKPVHERNKYGDAGDYRIVRGMLISGKSMEYISVNLIHNEFKEFN